MTDPTAPNPSEPTPDFTGPSPLEAAQPSAEDEQRARIAAAIVALEQGGQRGANWFFWVGGLSLVNSAIILSGGNTFFVIGLGVTLLADFVANGFAQQKPDIAMVVKGVAFGFDVFVALVVALFGWLSRKRIIPVFAIGMVLYLLDGLIFLLFQDWLSIAFHAFALFGMWKGIGAYRNLGRLE